jgi:hypothetical protein
VDRTKNLRNALIVLLIAGAVFALPGGGRAAATFEAVVMVGFGVAIGYLGLRAYREYRMSIYGLGDRYRALLYGSIAAGFLAIVARQRMWQTGLGELVWFVVVGLVVYALLAVVRHARSY